MKLIIKIASVASMCAFLLTGCTGKSSDSGEKNETKPKKDVNVTEIMEEINSSVELPEMTVISTDEYLETLYGISPDDVKQYAIEVNSNGVNQDEIIIIEAASGEAMGRLEETLNSLLEYKAAQMKDYLPEEYDMIMKCSVKKNGDFIYMVVSYEKDKIEKIIEKNF